MTGQPSPPARWRAALERCLPADRVGDVATELEELYRLRLARYGRDEADRWYREEVTAFMTLVPLSAVGRGVGSRWWNLEERMGEWVRDFRRAGRSLLRAPGFAAMAVATLTLGIGANTLIFSVVDHVVLRPLPYHEPDRLVTVWEGMQRQEIDIIRSASRTLDDVAGYRVIDGFNLGFEDSGVRVEGAMFEPGLLPLLGIDPALGRSFRPEESRAGQDGVALISHGLWMDRFGGDPAALGGDLLVDGRRRQIVGVLPAGFSFPHSGLDVVTPLVMEGEDPVAMWTVGGHRAVGRMAAGATPSDVRADALRAAETSRTTNPFWTPGPGYRQNSPVRVLQDDLVQDVRGTLLILLGAVGLVLLVACANVANLLLTRGLGRGRDLAVRTAMGASRGRLVREQIIESVLLALAGCAVALLGARWALDALVAFLPPDVPRAGEIGLDLRVATAGVVVAVLAGALAGAVPAWRGSKADPGTVLREGGRGGSASASRRRLTSGMVMAQMSLAVVLVVGAGLLVRSLGALAAVDPGFETEGLTTARLTLVGSQYETPAARLQFFDEISERLRSMPGVVSAAAGSGAPFSPAGPGGVATFIEDVTDDPNDLPVVQRYRVTPDYLETLGLRLVQGRTLTAADGADSRLVAVVDETMVDRFWPGENVIGRRIRYPWRGAPWIEVVGVVSGLHSFELSSERAPHYFVPMAQDPAPDATVLVRASDTDVALGGLVRSAVREIDARVPVSMVTEMDELVSGSLARARWTAVVLSLFALATLLLGCVGVYGVVAYSVRERTKEIGVRVALGAEPGRIRSRVLADGLRLALPGTVAGVLLALPAARLLEGLLYGVSAFDPLTFTAVPLSLLCAGVLAVYLPALRATRVDPVEALRSEG